MTAGGPGPPTESELLAGRYELGGILGRGGMGEVRAGRDRRLERVVAVKTLRPDLAQQDVVRRRFEREARSAARLTHPHVVAVHDVGEEDGIPYIVMEQVPGPTLGQEMAQGPMDPARARQLGGEILAALAAAHAAGMVHRDVKPGNVLLAADGSAKVTDFGIAKATDEPGASTVELDLTGPNQLIGTVAYMSPERVAGEAATVQSDLYSVGVILYEALSGTRPFAGDTPISLAWAIREARPQPLAELAPGLDPALVAVVERAMARRPESRFATAADMAAALRAAPGARGAEEAGDVSDAALTVVRGTPPGPRVARPATQILDLSPVSRAGALGPSEGAISRAGGLRRWILALVAVVALAIAWGLAASGSGDGGGEAGRPASPPTSAGAPAPTGGVPAPLDDAIKRLEEVVR